MNKKRLLVIGDSIAVPTGFGYVAGMFTKYFIESELYDVAFCSITGPEITGYDKITAIEDKEVFEKAETKFYHIDYYKNLVPDFRRIIEEFKPHIVFSVHDPWILEILALSEYTSSFFWVAYTTVETPKFCKKIYEMSLNGRNYKEIPFILNRAALTIPVTQMGRQALLDLGIKNVAETNIYNGLELDKECKEVVTRKKIFEGACPEDSFIFMTMGLNSERKKHERTIIAFRRFLDRVPNPEKYFLYMHVNIHGSVGGPDLSEVIEDNNLNNKIMALGNNSYCSKEMLYQIYKTCDCIIGLPGGEGFCYLFSEAMLHQKPIIFIDYGGHAEYAHHGGLSVKVSDYNYAMRLGMKWGLGDIDHAVSQMLRIAKEEGLRKKLSENGYKFVQENLGWDNISKQAIDVIEKHYSQSDRQEMYGSQLRRVV